MLEQLVCLHTFPQLMSRDRKDNTPVIWGQFSAILSPAGQEHNSTYQRNVHVDRSGRHRLWSDLPLCPLRTATALWQSDTYRLRPTARRSTSWIKRARIRRASICHMPHNVSPLSAMPAWALARTHGIVFDGCSPHLTGHFRFTYLSHRTAIGVCSMQQHCKLGA